MKRFRSRTRCDMYGHKYATYLDGFRPHVQCCRRWFCHSMRPDPMLPEHLRESLQRAIDGGWRDVGR